MRKFETLTWIIDTHWDQDSMGKLSLETDLDRIGDGQSDLVLSRACWYIAMLNTNAPGSLRIINTDWRIV